MDEEGWKEEKTEEKGCMKGDGEGERWKNWTWAEEKGGSHDEEGGESRKRQGWRGEKNGWGGGERRKGGAIMDSNEREDGGRKGYKEGDEEECKRGEERKRGEREEGAIK